MALAPIAIRNAKPDTRAYKLADEGGLYLLVKRRWISSSMVALGVAGLATWILPHFWRSEQTLTAPPLSVAILPFMVTAGNASDEQFADALTRDLTLGLGRSRRLQVISSSTSSSYKGRSIDAPSVGRELNVRYLIEGGVRRVDQRIAVYAQLIDAARAIQLWSDRVETRRPHRAGPSVTRRPTNASTGWSAVER